ncbi:MAG TPA: M48 family metallopeptidase [Patescibacteria group bacterium]|nr:M48 family metallopeptidase [Patescibacteria group bacterium]
MLKRLLFTALFLVIWLPALQFTATNATTRAPLPPASAMAGPYHWKYLGRAMDWRQFPPKMLILAQLADPKTAAVPPIASEADFIEWMYSGKSARHRVKKGDFFATGVAERPYANEWDIAHDKSMRFSLFGLRFNFHFLMGLFLCLLLPPLYALWMLADDIQVVTPAARKKRDDDFVHLVKLVEAKAAQDPQWLKRRTIRLALLGYAVVFGAILLMIPVGLGMGAAVLVLTGANAGAAKLAFILAAVPIGFSFAMAKSLLMPKFLPPGIEVNAQDAPQLFAFLAKIIEKAEGPRFQRVYISNEMNASVSRDGGFLGFFGFGPVTLTLGLPLMQALTKPQLASVVGHEYGHVAAKDNALGQWIYRIRTSWLILGDRLQFEQMWYALKLNRFYQWFIGVFSAYSFALSRRCEYEADAFAAKLAGAEHAAAALSAVAVRDHEVGTIYWRDQWKKSEAVPDPAAEAPYTALAGFFAQPRDQQEIIEVVTKETPGFASTHPTLMERLRALGQGFIPPQPIAQSGAAELLGPLEQKLTEIFNMEWLHNARPHWEAAHEEHKTLTARHAELKARALTELTREELMEYISASDRAKDDQSVIAASEELLAREPDNAMAKLNIAGLRLWNGDETQLPVLEGLAADKQCLQGACRHAIGYYHKQKRPEDAKSWEEKLSAWEYEREAGAEERQIVLATDRYHPHGLPETTVAAIARHCAQFKLLRFVYLARKEVRYLPEYPAYLIGFRSKGAFWSQKKLQEELNQFIATSGLGADFLFIDVTAISGLEGRLKKIPGALIYDSKKGTT